MSRRSPRGLDSDERSRVALHSRAHISALNPHGLVRNSVRIAGLLALDQEGQPIDTMQLTIDGRDEGTNPSPEQIASAVAAMATGNAEFVILEKESQSYMQASGSAKDGFELEYRSGSASEHFFCAEVLGERDITTILQDYLRQGGRWHTSHDWKKLSSRPKGKRTWRSGAIVNLPPVYLWVPILFFYLLIFVGKRYHLPGEYVVPAGFLLGALVAVGFTVWGFRRDGFTANRVPITRSQNPVQFWFCVIFGLVFAAALAVVAFRLKK